MKGTIGVIILLISSLATYGQMSGLYTVGSGGNYTTISDAIGDVNSQGLTGDVTLTISSGEYVEYVDLTNLNNSVFTVTLEGEDLDNTIISPAYVDTTPIAGIDLQDTDNITIRNLTVRMPFESATATQEMFGIYVEDASNISIENILILSFDGIEVVRGNNLDVFNTIVSAEKIAFEARASNLLNLVHNTFHTDQTGLISGPNVGTQAAVRFEGDNGNVSLTNNIFSGVVPDEPNGNAAIAVLNNLENLEISTNFNLFDADFSMAVYGESSNTNVNGTTVFEEYSLAEWNALGLDGNSVSLSPVFTNSTDFRIETTDYRFGTFLSDYNTDIDGETRVDGSVDVGADQYCVTIEVDESVAACESYDFAGLTLTESGEYVGEFVGINGCDSLVALNLTILEPTAGNEDITAEGSYDWNGAIYSESGIYEQTLTNQTGCDSVATLNLTIEPYFLEGNFVIGSSNAADFSDFTEAIAELQYATLTGDVEYFVEAGTYNDTLKLSSINTGDHSIVFNGEHKATTILHPVGGIDESKSGILIDGINNVTLQNLTLEMDDISDLQVSHNSSDTKGISVINAERITIDRVDFKNSSEVADHGSGTFYIATALYLNDVNELTASNCTFSGSGSHITLGEHANIDILKNTFQTARRAIRSTSKGNDLSIENNDFTGPFRFAMILEEVEDLSISSNDLDGVDNAESWDGISLSETINTIIQSNSIKNVEYGIVLDRDSAVIIQQNKVMSLSYLALEADETDDLTVANNFFGDVILLERQSNLDFIHNTVVLQLPDEREEAILVEVDDASNESLEIRVINNIVVGENQVTSRLMGIVMVNEKEDFSLDLTLDHNLYYLDDETGLKPVVMYEDNEGETSYSTLADWQTAEPYDQNSQSFEPSFISADDFHISSDVDYRFGTFIDDVTTDIDGDNRVESIGVDVGADQFCTTYDEVIAIEVCDSYTFDGVELTGSGQYQASFLSIQSCDSLVTLNLTILEPTSGEEEIEACESYEWNGVIYTTSGTYDTLLTNAAGCDSTATLVLTILESTSSEHDIETCDSFAWNGVEYTTSGTYDTLLTSATGCDSLVTLNLSILGQDFEEVALDACGSYTFGSQAITTSGVYEETFTNVQGCDSTVSLTLGIISEPGSGIVRNGRVLFAEDNSDGLTYQWINCATGEVLEGETTEQLTPLVEGEYAVMMSNGSCEVISACMTVEGFVLSVDENAISEVSIFPNPTSGDLFIELPANAGRIRSVVHTIGGRLVHLEVIEGQTELQLALKDAGLYLVTVNFLEQDRPSQTFKVLRR